MAPPHFIHPACPSAECLCPVPPPPADGGLPCPGGLPASPRAAQAWRARQAPGHKGGAARGKPRAAGQELLRAEPSTLPRALPATLPALHSPLPCFPLGARFWVCLFQVTRTCVSVGRVPSRLLRRPAGRACAGGCLRTPPGPCSPRPPPGVLVKGYLSGGPDGKNSGKVSPCFGEQSSEVVGVVEIQRCHRACM